MRNCRFCYNFGANGSTDVWDKPLIESANFVVVPSLGSLVPGWVLLLPKDHYLAMGALPSSMLGEMEQIKCALIHRLGRAYEELCAFEHGPSGAKRDVGCGVDHAHLHVVPVKFDLARAAVPFLPGGLAFSEANFRHCRQAFAEGLDYLYLEQPLGRGRIAVHEHFGSQLFRRAIASHLGLDDEYNWRDYPQINNVTSTVQTLQNVASEDSTDPAEVESVA